MKILVINGPNMNLLGKREPQLYGNATYRDLIMKVEERARELDVMCMFFQSNHEGAIIDVIQKASDDGIDGIIINAAGYSHTSIAIMDCLKAVGIHAVEVHVTDPMQREDFRHIDYVGLACELTIAGHGIDGYVEALEFLCQ